MTVVSELCDPLDGHATTVAAWLSGTIPTGRSPRTSSRGITIDQVIANKIGQDTPFPSLELATEDFTGWIGGCDTAYSCAYMNTISWKNDDHAAADGDQPARRVRADVRPPGHERAAPGADAGQTAASSTRSARKRRDLQKTARAARTARG